MNESQVFANLVAYALGTRSLAASLTWTDEATEELRELVRRGPLKHVSLALLDPIVDSFGRAGGCPVSSAAKLIAGEHAGLDWSDPGGERVLRAALPAELTELLRGTSRQVSVSSRWRDLPQRCADVEVADAHVHSGGVSPPTVLIRTLLSHLSEVSEEGFPVTFEVRDCASERFSVEPVLLALGISCTLLQLDREPNLDLRAMLPLLGSDATRLWPLAFELMKDGDSESLQPLRRAYNELMKGVGAPGLQAGIIAVPDWLGGSLDAVRGELARGCLAGISLLHAALVSPTSATLDLFVERFNLLRRLRGLANATDIDRIEESLRFMLSAGKLKRVELRKTAAASIAAADGQERDQTELDIATDILYHATAVRRVRVQHPDLVVQMPISFHRYPVTGSQMDLRRARLRHPLQGLSAVAKGIASVCARSPEVRDFVGSVDVAGSELAAPNWAFGLAFSYIDRAMAFEGVEPLRYTVHAGEQFYTPLDGLRRVGETLLFEVPVTRIGHGLALSPDTARRRPSPLPSAAEVMESLVWAARCEPELRDAVDDLSRDLASVVFRPWNPSFDELLAWHAARFDFDRMQRIGFMPDPERFRTELIPVGERVEVASLRMSDRVDRMVVASLVDAVVDVAFDPSAPVPPTYRKAAEDLSAHCYEKCLGPVRAAFEERCTIESCPSSNLTMADLRALEAHPVGEFKRAGLQVTVNSDDPGLFGALVEEEIIGLYESGVLGSADEAGKHLEEILAHSSAEAANGLTSERCAELVEALGTGDLT